MEKSAAFASDELTFEAFTQSALMTVAPELAKDGDPEYFTNKINVQRYNYIHNTLMQLCGQSILVKNMGEEETYATPKLVIGTVKESDLYRPISLAFSIGHGAQPEFLRADWSIELGLDLEPKSYLDSVVEKTIRRTIVYRAELMAPSEPGRDEALTANLKRRNNLNFLVRSLECYERNLFEANPESKTKKHRRALSDEIGQAVTSLLAVE